MDEHRAIALCIKHRDPIGFEFLVRQYRREAFFHAYALLGNQEEALDACQDSFANAFAAIPRLKKLTQFYPWFYCILKNRCLNLLARRKTADRFKDSEVSQSAQRTELADPSSILERREEQQQVRRALDALGPDHREILAMKYIQGNSYEEIADLLELPRGTVMSRLYHARIAFRRIYQKEMDLTAQPHTQSENAT